MSELFLIFEMKGYGFFIWSAYGVWFVLLILLFLKVLIRKKEIKRKLKYLTEKSNGFEE
jgi:heme exporter protein CcmD